MIGDERRKMPLFRLGRNGKARSVERSVSQKTCLDARLRLRGQGYGLKILRIKKGNPRIDEIGPGIFFGL